MNALVHKYTFSHTNAHTHTLMHTVSTNIRAQVHLFTHVRVYSHAQDDFVTNTGLKTHILPPWASHT